MSENKSGLRILGKEELLVVDRFQKDINELQTQVIRIVAKMMGFTYLPTNQLVITQDPDDNTKLVIFDQAKWALQNGELVELAAPVVAIEEILQGRATPDQDADEVEQLESPPA